jgi:hypothetical protein
MEPITLAVMQAIAKIAFDHNNEKTKASLNRAIAN